MVRQEGHLVPWNHVLGTQQECFWPVQQNSFLLHLPACLPAGLPAIETFNGAHQWFGFISLPVQWIPPLTILTSPASEGESTKVNSTCTQHDAHHSSPQASRSRMITVSPFPSVLNPGNQVTPRRDYGYPQKVSAVRLGGIYQLDISQCMTKCKLWRTQSQQQHVEWCFSTLLCLIKLSVSYYLRLRIAMTFYGECISISNPNNVIKQFVCTPNNVV